MSRTLTFRQSAALGVAALGIEAVFSAATPNLPARQRLIGRIAPPALPSMAHLLALIAGLALLVLVPKLWRGTRTAVTVAFIVLVALAILNLVKGLDYDESALDLCFATLLAAGRSAFQLGCRNRPPLTAICAAVGAWAVTYCALLAGPLASDRGHTLNRALHTSIGHPHLNHAWVIVIELLIGLAVVISLLAVRSLLAPAAAENAHDEHQYRAAREIVRRHGEDSLAPFILRPDKALHFAAGGVLAYHVIGETAIVSGDPVAPVGAAGAVLESFRQFARARGWQIVVWGASAETVEPYRRLGLHALRTGEEAFSDPAEFSLDGRKVRKLRQSVNRLERLGWRVSIFEDADVEPELEREIALLEARWRSQRSRILGFAMGMGPWKPERLPGDLYLLARSPEGELRAVMRFAEHRGKLSLDTMRRVGEHPNGLNEALICRALEAARERGVPEVSLNYAGLGHLFREEHTAGSRTRRLARFPLSLLAWRFQMARLVRFDNKFAPEWRPRYLVFESRTQLPLAVLRVLQVEGYLPQRAAPRLPRRWRGTAGPLSGSRPQADVAS